MTDGIPVTSAKLHSPRTEKGSGNKQNSQTSDQTADQVGNGSDSDSVNADSDADKSNSEGAQQSIPQGTPQITTAMDSRLTGERPPLDFEDDPDMYFITEETPYSIRFFIVYYNADGNIRYINLHYINTITRYEAAEYAREALEEDSERGWIERYRYKVSSTPKGFAIAFVDGNTNVSILRMVMITAAFVLFASVLLILCILVLYSKRAVKPVAESYEKQRQFVTDASHELKTPLTLILTNVDIAEQQIGKNEWLDDIRTEGHRMNELVNQLVTLSRMDENSPNIEAKEFNISSAVLDTISGFSNRIEREGKTLTTEVENDIVLTGDESLIRRLTSILLDNAVKYCDEKGSIAVNLTGKRRVVLTVENSYKDVENTELDKLFDRFYRSDKVRTYSGSYGVGLSIAKSIAESHGGEISAYKKDDSTIGFKVVLKK